MSATRAYISKTGFMKGEQCELAFYYWWHKTEEAFSDAAQVRLDEGTEIGILAHQLAPGGINRNELDLPPWTLSEKTLAHMKDKKPIYEATFLSAVKPQLLCKVDILVPDKNGWQIWEVKSSTSVKEEYISDLAFQTYVLQTCGIRITKSILIHLNNEYIRHGEIDIELLFKKNNLTKEVKALLPDMEENIHMMYKKGTLPKAPIRAIGAHCDKPYTCSYQYLCWKNFPETDTIFSIPRMGKNVDIYLNAGVYKLKDINPETLTEKQRLVWNAHVHKTIVIDKIAIRNFFNSMTYPLFFFDFETVMPALPIWNGTGPYNQIPFQYSLHVIQEPGATPIHFEFLDDASGIDPRPALIKQMIIDLGTSGTIWAYNKTFEIGQLKTMALAFPEFATALHLLVERFNDLLIPFREQWYYHPDMQGSNSIKNVLPVLVPELSYKQMEIGDGGAAMQAFLLLLKKEKESMKKKQSILNNLRSYCKLDTLAMVRIMDALMQL